MPRMAAHPTEVWGYEVFVHGSPLHDSEKQKSAKLAEQRAWSAILAGDVLAPSIKDDGQQSALARPLPRSCNWNEMPNGMTFGTGATATRPITFDG